MFLSDPFEIKGHPNRQCKWVEIVTSIANHHGSQNYQPCESLYFFRKSESFLTHDFLRYLSYVQVLG